MQSYDFFLNYQNLYILSSQKVINKKTGQILDRISFKKI